MVNIKIEQQHLDTILEALMLKNTFPYCPLEIRMRDKVPSLVSFQENENRSIFRYGRFMKDFFKYIEPKESKIFINAQKLHKIIAKDEPESIIGLREDGDKLIIESPKVTAELNLLDNVVGACTELPFDIGKDGVVCFKSGKGPLENIFTMPSSSLREIVGYGGVLETEIYQFILDDKRKISILVGNLEPNSEKVTYLPSTTVSKYTSPVNATLSLGVSEIANTFSSDITVQCKTNYPVWFSEEDQKHKLGVLIAPRIEKEEE